MFNPISSIFADQKSDQRRRINNFPLLREHEFVTATNGTTFSASDWQAAARPFAQHYIRHPGERPDNLQRALKRRSGIGHFGQTAAPALSTSIMSE